MGKPPWSSGPGEILQHGLSLLAKDTDTHRRLAMLSIDNAVELTVKTFLGLPKRVTGISIGRGKYDDISESFPKLLDALEEFAKSKISGIDLGELEWYHRLRNQLYHDGNGLTVERQKVEVYAELAKLLFERLFGHPLEVQSSPDFDLMGRFLRSWANLEHVLMLWTQKINPKNEPQSTMPLRAIGLLQKKRILDRSTAHQIQKLRAIRNECVHSHGGKEQELPEITLEMIQNTDSITGHLKVGLDKYMEQA